MKIDAAWPGALARNLLLGLYVLGGEWLWVVRRLTLRSDTAKAVWREAQIARRIQLFSLEKS